MTGRFAPSPTGPLHLGNLRTALIAWLFARSERDNFLLRVEDLDPERCRPEHERGQLQDLQILGLDWDGVPVRQSERGMLFRDAFEDLRRQERLYPCWCTRAELARVLSAPHDRQNQGVYPGTCRRLSDSQRAACEHEHGRPRAWRLDAKRERVGFVDRLHGPVELEVEDFVVWRGDAVAAYNLAVVVDDAAQAVQHVVRGDDLLEGTPRQVLLARLLGLRAPTYTHLPLVLGPDGRRLAKRDGAVTLSQRLALGEPIEAIVGWMAAGLGLIDQDEQINAQALLKCFDASKLRRSPTVFRGTITGP
ncbi:MAG TPA: tRNA glutamyl-Q(34) synthetase GluQRS [Solirubrobacteraceae bacterium]|jgi:glutamyl-tRNA synthetase